MRKRNAGFTLLQLVASVPLPGAMRSGPNQRPTPFVDASAGVMPAEALIDTGAILALLDCSDRWHHACTGAFTRLRLPLLTSETVLNELFHLVGDVRIQMESA